MALTIWKCGKCHVVSQALPPQQPTPAGPCPADPPTTPPAKSFHQWVEVPNDPPPAQ